MYLLLCCGGGFLRSTDEGKTWENLSTGLPSNGLFFSLNVDPKNGEIVYLTVDLSIYKTVNGGKSWTRIATLDSYGPYLYSLAINPKNTSILYAGLGGSGGCVLRSIDAGNSWQAPNCNGGVWSIVIDNKKPSLIFAVGDFLQRSLDGGTSWQILKTPPRNFIMNLSVAIHPLVSEFVYVGDATNGVFRSKNTGESWSPVNRGMNSLGIQQVVSGGANKLFSAAINWELYQKNSEQSSWIINKALMTKRVEQIAVYPTNPNIIAVGGDFSDENENFESTPNVAVTTDGGASWHFGKALEGGICCFYKTLSFHSQNPNILFMSVFNSSGAFAGVAKSVDQGRTWKLSNAGLKNPRVAKLTVGLEPESPVFALTERTAEVYRSDNSAESWEKLSIPLKDESPFDIAAGLRAIYVSTITHDRNSRIYFSSDRGRTWTRMHQFSADGDLPIANIAIDPWTPSTIFAYNSFGTSMFKSTNSGKNWISFHRPQFTINDMIIDAFNHNTYHVATGRGVFSYSEK